MQSENLIVPTDKQLKYIHPCREMWLEAAVELIRPYFLKFKLEIPEYYKISCGLPSKNIRKRLGECWYSEATEEGFPQVFISPLIKNEMDILATVVHESIHLHFDSDPKVGHSKKFKDAAFLVGLEGPATATVAGLQLLNVLEPIAETLGPFPNPVIHLKEKTKKEKAEGKKSFKVFCEKKRNCDKHCSLVTEVNDGGGEFSVTVSRKSLALGFPMCPCGNSLQMEESDYELYKLGIT